MTSLNRNARIAGLLYLTLLTAPLRLLYIPGKLFVAENASATANNIAAHETLFRLGILSGLFTATVGRLAFEALMAALQRDRCSEADTEYVVNTELVLRSSTALVCRRQNELR
jgi:hypothetical protein